MDAIAGICRFDAGAGTGDAVEAMLDALADRSGAAPAVRAEGPCVLAHKPGRLGTDAWPRDLGDGTLLTADVRVDNPGEVASALPEAREADAPGPATADAALVGEAWRRWGPGLVEPVVGRYAVGAWEADRDRLVLVRDALGLAPLYVADLGDGVAFATERSALLALDDLPDVVDGARIPDFVARRFRDKEATFHRAVRRLPPGHTLVVGPGGTARLDRHWDPRAIPQDPTMTLQEAADGLRRALEAATAARVRGAEDRTGTFLSGGLDSSTTTSVARQVLPEGAGMRTYSWAFEGVPRSDETPYARAVLDGLDGVEPTFLPGDAGGPLDGLDGVVDAAGEPVWMPNLFLHRRTYQAAAGDDVAVLIDGLDGDTTVGHGTAYLAELLRAGRGLAAWRRARALAEAYGASGPRVLWRHAVRPHVPDLLRRVASQVRWGLRGARGVPAHLRLLRPGLVRRYVGAGSADPHDRGRATDAAQHRARVDSALVPYALEVLDLVAAREGVVPRYPFFDRRVVEHCLRVPARHRLQGGRTRYFLREAMRGRLPEKVRRRPGKTSLGPNFDHAVRSRQRDAFVERLAPARVAPLGRWLVADEVADLRARIDRGACGDGDQDALAALAVATLTTWWRRSDPTVEEGDQPLLPGIRQG